jgi:hypothetical protein
MKVQKVKVWWQKLDADGNEIEKGCDNKEYMNWGSAINRAEKLFGSRRHQTYIETETPEGAEPRIRWRISHRDPFTDYYEERECDICGTVHKRKHTDYGCDLGNYFWISMDKDDPDHKYRGRSIICPECKEKLVKCIKKLEKGGKK